MDSYVDSEWVQKVFTRGFIDRSEGVPERDMISLRMMGWGLAAVTRPLGICFLENITTSLNFMILNCFVFQIHTLSRVFYQSKCPKSEISKNALRTSR